MLRDQLDIALASVPAFVGLAALVIAFIRRRGEGRILMWFGLLTGTYAGRMLLWIASRQPGISDSTSRGLGNTIDVISYLFIIVASLFWLELSPGAMRRFIKIAMQSVVDCAHDPGMVLRGLNRILSGQTQGQFVTAAYLWVDSMARTARYSAAGHPPLLHWRAADSDLRCIESNGLLFGVTPDVDYPVCDFALVVDRILRYSHSERCRAKDPFEPPAPPRDPCSFGRGLASSVVQSLDLSRLLV